ncbi:hypothetical protein GXY_06665 [Novacetimonas hansenii ATCC 23769]|uniref:Uncharacterized protein n=1 Tax=Novacetimonas hansenii ATCC 23769 TaxID=714995 RepID=D5QDX0_NOVHA|nr:hypothetical protein GXY_06665 [Novacetimonas hansenii ATCC 23769]
MKIGRAKDMHRRQKAASALIPDMPGSWESCPKADMTIAYLYRHFGRKKS